MVDGELNLERSYINNWEGLIFLSISGNQLQAYIIDCRHTKDQLDDMVAVLLKAKNKLEPKK